MKNVAPARNAQCRGGKLLLIDAIELRAISQAAPGQCRGVCVQHESVQDAMTPLDGDAIVRD